MEINKARTAVELVMQTLEAEVIKIVGEVPNDQRVKAKLREARMICYSVIYASMLTKGINFDTKGK